MSILKDIIEWVEDKPLFWQEAVNRIIRNKSLTQGDITELVGICKYENKIIELEYTPVDIEELKELVDSSSIQESIKLSKIKNNENINALKDHSVLGFSSIGLTGIYGDNGSGKSSFVSVLKNTCNTRGDLPIINHNLFDPDGFAKRQIAQVEYLKEDGDTGDVTWEDARVDSTILKAIDVFDSLSANHYIDGQDEIAFIPSGLSVVERLANACKEVEHAMGMEKEDLRKESYDYSFMFDDIETEVSKFLRGLNEKSKQADLDKLSGHSKESEARIKKLSEQIIKLKATDPAKEIRENSQKIKRYESLKARYEKLETGFTETALNSVRDKINIAVLASKNSKAASEKAFSNLPLDEIGSDQWKALWESARKFYDGIKGQGSFPNSGEDENCPLCLQELGEEARHRFLNFEEFVKGDLQEQLQTANTKLRELKEYFENLDFDLLEAKPTIEEIQESSKEFEEIETLFLSALEVKKDKILSFIENLKTIDSIACIEFEDTPAKIITAHISELGKINEKLAKISIEKQLVPLEKEYANLLAVKNLTIYKKQIEEEIKRKKKIVALNVCSSQCNTRNVTLLSNNLTQTYVTNSLKENFKEELAKLGFKNIKVATATKGVRGTQYHFLELDTSYGTSISLKEILSEGEHRCISLATFLSELSISEHKSAIIFDDPVSSLDHKWRSKIAKRIAQEALERQVIVFTHDITFLMMLQEEAKKIDCNIDIKSLTRKKTETGIPASSPPWDALPIKGRLGELKTLQQALKKSEDEETEEVYREKVKTFYGKLRETWERLIEELILNKTVQRFGRAIQTNRLKKVIDLTPVDYQKVEDNMSKCSTMFTGHDSAGDLIEAVPDSDEVNTDVGILEAYIKELRSRGRS